MHGWNDWLGGHMIGMGILWILLLVALVTLVVWLARTRGTGSRPTASGEGGER